MPWIIGFFLLVTVLRLLVRRFFMRQRVMEPMPPVPEPMPPVPEPMPEIVEDDARRPPVPPSPPRNLFGEIREHPPTANTFEIESRVVEGSSTQQVSAITIGVKRNTWIIWKCWMLLGSGGVTIGYTTSVLGGVLAQPLYMIKISHRIFHSMREAYQNDFCTYISMPLILHSSIIPFFGMIGVSFTAYTKSWGRRLTVIFGGVLFLLGTVLMTWFPHIIVDIVGQAITGFGVGVLYQVIPILCSQTLPNDARKPGSLLFQRAIAIGSLLASSINYLSSYYHIWGWRLSLGVMAIPGMTMLFVSTTMHEPPQHFIQRGELHKGKDALRVIRGTNDVDVEFNEILDVHERNKDKKSFREIFRSKNLPLFVITVAATFLTKFMGVEVLTFYGAFILQSLHYNKHGAFLGQLILVSSQTFSKLVGVHVIEVVGRTKTFSLACVASFIAMISIGVLFHLNYSVYDYLSPHRAIGGAALAVAYFAASGVLPGPLDWLESGYGDECEELGSALSICLGFLLSCVTNFTTFPMLCALREFSFFTYAATALLLLASTLFFVPETTNVKEDDMIEVVWSHHWFWRRWVQRSPNTIVV